MKEMEEELKEIRKLSDEWVGKVNRRVGNLL